MMRKGIRSEKERQSVRVERCRGKRGGTEPLTQGSSEAEEGTRVDEVYSSKQTPVTYFLQPDLTS